MMVMQRAEMRAAMKVQKMADVLAENLAGTMVA